MWICAGNGAANSGFPDSAVTSRYGGDSRAANSFGYSTLDIVGNTFTDNWGGVVLWENANRFCGDGYDDACTLVAPSSATMSKCPSALSNSAINQPNSSPDYFDLCRWKTQNVTVSDNVFNFNPANIGSLLHHLTNNCGFNGLFSEYGSASRIPPGSSRSISPPTRTMSSRTTATPGRGTSPASPSATT